MRTFSAVAKEKERKVIMKKLLALSVLALTVFGSTLGPAIAPGSLAIRSERGVAGWDGPPAPRPDSLSIMMQGARRRGDCFGVPAQVPCQSLWISVRHPRKRGEKS